MLTLVVMAAGMGSRYGSLKQVDPIGVNGELILDYSIYDAVKAGFEKVVFIIKEEDEVQFKTAVGNRFNPHIHVVYAYQSIQNMPRFNPDLDSGRKKPWGTGHAVYCAKELITDDFVVINADDFYGREAFQEIVRFFKQRRSESEYAMVGFNVCNTLTENGTVSRGVCEIDSENELSGILEHPKIFLTEKGVFSELNYDTVRLEESSVVSMNFWGFNKHFFTFLEDDLNQFYQMLNADNRLTSEFYLPTAVQNVITHQNAKVTVIQTRAKWFGVTYKEDREVVVKAIKEMIDSGIYPESLWE